MIFILSNLHFTSRQNIMNRGPAAPLKKESFPGKATRDIYFKGGHIGWHFFRKKSRHSFVHPCSIASSIVISVSYSHQPRCNFFPHAGVLKNQDDRSQPKLPSRTLQEATQKLATGGNTPTTTLHSPLSNTSPACQTRENVVTERDRPKLEHLQRRAQKV